MEHAARAAHIAGLPSSPLKRAIFIMVGGWVALLVLFGMLVACKTCQQTVRATQEQEKAREATPELAPQFSGPRTPGRPGDERTRGECASARRRLDARR